jgi:hypothetical protein
VGLWSQTLSYRGSGTVKSGLQNAKAKLPNARRRGDVRDYKSDGKPAHEWRAPLEDGKHEQARQQTRRMSGKGGVNSRYDRMLPS